MLDIKDYEAMVKLDLPESERGELVKRVLALVGGFAELDKINADNIQPMAAVLGLHSVLREDVAHKLLTRDELLRNAPEQYDGYFQVPGTLD